MELWTHWMNLVERLRPAFSRESTYLWFVTTLVGCSIRSDMAGVTSFVRACWLKECHYQALRRMFHSPAVRLGELTRLWVQQVFAAFAARLVRVDGRAVLVLDGVKAPKEGRKMPAVKSLHQESTNNSKPEYIMGHSWQAVSVLAQSAKSLVAVPLSARIHEGVVFTNRDERTLLDRAIELIDGLGDIPSFYLLADAYYACRKVGRAIVARGSHLISRLKITAVAYRSVPAVPGPRKRGRPKLYGEKVPVRTLFDDPSAMTEIQSPYDGDSLLKIRYRSADLLWKPLGRIARLVAVEHPNKGRRVFICTDLTRDPMEVIHMYSWRFKIEFGFHQVIHVLGAYRYRFWLKVMKRIRRKSGDQYLHRKTDDYRAGVRRKILAYELHVQIGLIAQGLLMYLACFHSATVWQLFRSWLRTIRPGVPPSELVTAAALREGFPDFLVRSRNDRSFTKFLADKMDMDRTPGIVLAA